MDMETEQSSPTEDVPPITVPTDIKVTLQGSSGETQEELKELGDRLATWVGVISTVINLSALDGITAVVDYEGALANFDRGVDALKENSQLEPTNDGNAVGVAMTPALLKDGKVKSHIFFRYDVIRGIGSDREAEEFRTALHVLAHECAHVEATSKFDSAFPSVLFHEMPGTELDRAKWKYAIDRCWQEYVVCRRSADIGKNILDGDVEVLLNTLSDIGEKADRMVEECKSDKDYGKVFYGLFQVYGNLMMYACYVLGTMHGLMLTVEDVLSLKHTLAGSWFATYFNRLGVVCQALYESYGTWPNYREFDAIGDLLEEIVARKGVRARPHGDGLYVTLNTLPPSGSDLQRFLHFGGS